MGEESPQPGTYWTQGVLTTFNPMMREVYATCARCGAFVNSTTTHDKWHRTVEGQP